MLNCATPRAFDYSATAELLSSRAWTCSGSLQVPARRHRRGGLLASYVIAIARERGLRVLVDAFPDDQERRMDAGGRRARAVIAFEQGRDRLT